MIRHTVILLVCFMAIILTNPCENKQNIYLCSYIFSFAINYEYIIRNKNKPAACQGVMYRMGGRLNAYDAIASYNKQMGGTML